MSLLCETLSASGSAYYAWRQHELGPRRREDNRLMPTIRSVFWEHRRRYGARRIAVELAARNEPCGRRRVGRLMAQMGLVAIRPWSFKPRTTDSRHTLGYRPNLLIDAPPPDGINQLWVGDITYAALLGGDSLYGFLYGGDADGSFFASHRRLGFAGSYARNPGNYGLAGRDSSTPPQARFDSPHRSRRPVRQPGLPRNTRSRWDAPKHEPCRGLLR